MSHYDSGYYPQKIKYPVYCNEKFVGALEYDPIFASSGSLNILVTQKDVDDPTNYNTSVMAVAIRERAFVMDSEWLEMGEDFDTEFLESKGYFVPNYADVSFNPSREVYNVRFFVLMPTIEQYETIFELSSFEPADRPSVIYGDSARVFLKKISSAGITVPHPTFYPMPRPPGKTTTGSISAEKIVAGSISAEKITTGSILAAPTLYGMSVISPSPSVKLNSEVS